ncbi:MAG: hypothetical protein HWN80_08680 [Candidatus Lokiarchaeota archaeon]|nr:hypothetical protein [Candidatus Lokiarchaeota archaeon]
MEMEKKNLAIIILAVALVASGVGNIIFGVLMGGITVIAPPPPSTIIYGSSAGPVDADPQYMWDSTSFDHALNIYEGLFAYNLSDPDTPLIPRLALDFGTWSTDDLELTLTLRHGVTFHSGYAFNASAVKFSFDRLNWLCNFSGDLPADVIYGSETIISVLYMWPDYSAIINRTEIIDEYTVKFVLNRVYGILLPLLTFPASYILDPSVTPGDDYLSEGMSGFYGSENNAEIVSGTGPWKFEYYIAGIESKYVRFDDYWGGAGAIESWVMAVIQDADARNTALLVGDVNFLDAPHPSYYQEMRDSDAVELYEAGPGTITSYLGFNNLQINVTWRTAMSYALDYDYIIDELREGDAVRLKSPIPLGIQFANWSFDCPTLDLTIARSVMNSMGFGTGLVTDQDWIDVAESPTPFLAVNYTYNLGNKFREDCYVLLESNFANIGIKVIDAGAEWEIYLDKLYNVDGGWDKLQIWWIGWIPDYNDPSNYVNSLMSNVSSSASTQCSTPELEAFMLAGLEETDQDIRRQIYHDMQKYIVEELRPWAFGYVPKNVDAYATDLKGYPSNGMGYNYFYPMYFEN